MVWPVVGGGFRADSPGRALGWKRRGCLHRMEWGAVGLAEGTVCAKTQWEKEVGGSFGAGKEFPSVELWADFRR